MEKEQRKELYQKAILKWGELPQINMVYEEAGELVTALARYLRGREDANGVITELADVSIMIEQMATMFGYEAYENEKDRKLERLKTRLDDKK